MLLFLYQNVLVAVCFTAVLLDHVDPAISTYQEIATDRLAGTATARTIGVNGSNR